VTHSASVVLKGHGFSRVVIGVNLQRALARNVAFSPGRPASQRIVGF